MGPKVSVSIRVPLRVLFIPCRTTHDGGQTTDQDQPQAVCALFFRPLSSVLRPHFLRKRSSRTTSPPPTGLSGSSSDPPGTGELAGRGTAASGDVVRLCSAGGRPVLPCLPGAAAPSGTCAPPASSESCSNCRPNCTEGSKNP